MHNFTKSDQQTILLSQILMTTDCSTEARLYAECRNRFVRNSQEESQRIALAKCEDIYKDVDRCINDPARVQPLLRQAVKMPQCRKLNEAYQKCLLKTTDSCDEANDELKVCGLMKVLENLRIASGGGRFVSS